MNKFNTSKWDTENSSYYVVTHFTNGKQIQVYSKKIGMHERNDKTALLTNWICRMYRDGYLNQADHTKTEIKHIVVYSNFTDQPHEILMLTYTSFSILDANYFENVDLITFLEKFYKLTQDGCKPEEIIQKLYVNSRTTQIDELDSTEKRFTQPMYLVNYCEELISRKQNPLPENAVKDFFRNYMEKHFSKAQEDIRVKGNEYFNKRNTKQ